MPPPPLHRRRTELPDDSRSRRHWRNLYDLWPFLWEYRGRVLFALLALVLAKVANVGVPVVLKHIVDALDATQQQAVTVLPLALLAGYGALRLANVFFRELQDLLFARVRYRAMRRLSTRFLAHLHDLSLRYHLERKTGALSRDLDRGTQSVSTLLNYLVFSIVPTLVEFVLVSVVLLSSYAIHFTLIVLLTVVLYVAFTLAITEWRIQYRVRMNELESRANSQAVDSLINYETVKYFCREQHENHRYDHTLMEWEESAMKSQTSMSLLNFGQSTIIALGVTVIMILASHGVLAGEMSIGDLVLVNAVLLQLFIPLNFLGFMYRGIKYALIDMDEMFRLLESSPEINDADNAQPLKITGGGIQFNQVNFHYQTDRHILQNISFFLPAGKTIAVVGPSGAGKSTLARLLMRFYDVSEGHILIDGQNISEVTQHSLRNAIGIVPQDTVLFNETIYYNIAYAHIDATVEEVHEAAQLANIHDFIISLPNGYDTLVGERGLKLSGGEKQRVAIARAILKRPRILIFDEATSSLDSRSEKIIQTALSKVAAQRTTLIIAHRLSTIVDAHQILVMEYGQIVERGTHTELLNHNGIYAHMWALQQQEEAEQLELMP